MKKQLTAMLLTCLIMHAGFAQTIYSRNTIKGWLTTGARPTQAQYWEWLDSYTHKQDTISMNRITGLSSALNTANAISLPVVDSLKQTTAIPYMRATVADPVRGGNFIARLAVDGFVIDSGIVFKSATSGIVWVRDASQSEAINLKWFGARGLGLSSVTEDTTALRAAFAFLKLNGGGRLYVPNTTKFYAFAGKMLIVPDNTEIFGDGKGKSIIRAVAPPTSQYPGAIFLFSTFGPTTANGLFQTQLLPYTYNLSDAKIGDSVLVLADATKAAALYVGEVVFYGSQKYYHSADTAKPRYVGECNEVVKISGANIFFKNPIAVDLKTTASGSPVIININNNNVINAQMGVVNHTTKNVSIHDMSFQQAQRDELADTVLNIRLAGIWSPGGAYNAHFYNLDIDAYNGIGGNMWTHTEMNNIKLSEERHFFDGGFDTYDISIHDIEYTFKNSDVSDFAATLIICNDAFHHARFYNINCSGTRSANNISIFTDAWDVQFYNCNFNFPNYRADEIGINIADGDSNGVATHDLNFYNLKIITDTIGLWLRIAGDSTENTLLKNRNISVHDIVFSGHKYYTDFPNDGIYIRRMSGVSVYNINIPEGRAYIESEDSLTLSNINAPNSRLHFEKSKVGSVFNNNIFASSDSVAIPSNSLNVIGGQLSLSPNSYSLNQVYAGVDTWDGTPPSGTPTKSYSWIKTGSEVNLQIQIKYSTAGTTNTSVTLAWPTGAPLPIEPTAFSNSGDNMVIGRGQIGVNSSSLNTNGSAAIFKTGFGTYNIKIGGNSVSAKAAWANITYISQ